MAGGRGLGCRELPSQTQPAGPAPACSNELPGTAVSGEGWGPGIRLRGRAVEAGRGGTWDLPSQGGGGEQGGG